MYAKICETYQIFLSTSIPEFLALVVANRWFYENLDNNSSFVIIHVRHNRLHRPSQKHLKLSKSGRNRCLTGAIRNSASQFSMQLADAGLPKHASSDCLRLLFFACGLLVHCLIGPGTTGTVSENKPHVFDSTVSTGVLDITHDTFEGPVWEERYCSAWIYSKNLYWFSTDNLSKHDLKNVVYSACCLMWSHRDSRASITISDI